MEIDKVQWLQWPRDAAERGRLAVAGMPCLLFVEAGTPPPATASPIEDWIWTNAPTNEVTARATSLELASADYVAVPTLDSNGMLTYRGKRVALPPVETILMRELMENFAGVVSREQLSERAWGDTPPGRNALDVHVLRIRRRIEPIGLVLRTFRSRGYLLDGGATEPGR